MLYNILLVSAIHQHESAIGIHMSLPSGSCLPHPTISHPCRLSRAPCLRSTFPLAAVYISTFRKQRSWHLVPSLHGKYMRKQWKQCQTLFLGGSKITADGHCSHKIKRHLLLGRKVMTNLDSILKSRDITLPTKVCLVKAMVFPVVMYGCESWTIKKAEC